MATQTVANRQSSRPHWGQVALQADGVVSFVCGVIAVADSTALAAFTGLSRGVLLALGAFLVAYGLALFLAARDPRRVPRLLGSVFYGNIAWVLASIVALLLAHDLLTTGGSWLVASQAVVVADLALAQFIARRRAA